MPGERRFYRDLRGLEIADLANENYVRILSEKRSQSGSEVQSDRFLHLNLIHAHQVELDRILGGHYIRLRRVQALKRRVKGRGLAGPRWPGHQHHSVRL